jgi:ankyrin repeat protein
MYIAANSDHSDLALTMMKLGGIRADEPVGYHPTRQWCKSAVQHVDALKTPVHEAARAGQLGVLRTFIHLDIGNVLTVDGNGMTPLNVALRWRQKQCASFLLTKQWSQVTFDLAMTLTYDL